MRCTFLHCVTIVSLLAACGQDVSAPPVPSPPGADAATEPAAAEDAGEAIDVEEVVTPLPEGPATGPPSAQLPPVGRLVAIGDVHGDIAALRSALQLAGVVASGDHWVGGTTTVVQVGDQLDRGEDEREILHWLEQLSEEARAVGGALYPLHGNHELMNVDLDLRYVTEGGFADFADVSWDPEDALYGAYPEAEKGRVAAFRPGGPYALMLAPHAVSLMVGDTVFVHGGLLPEHVAYGIDTINDQTRIWMEAGSARPTVTEGEDSPVWSRHYSDDPDVSDCVLLEETLAALGAARMVVAHTVQYGGITSACQDQVWRVDVGLAAYYGGATQVLVIEGDTVSVIP